MPVPPDATPSPHGERLPGGILPPEELSELHRLANLGRVVAGVAHDLNNLLGVVRIYSEMMAEDFPPAERNHRFLREIGLAIDQGSALVQRLMDISANRSGEPAQDSLNRILCEMEPVLHCIMDERVTVEFAYAREISPVLVDRLQLQQAILNLALNAKQAMPGTGELRLATKMVRLTAQAGEVPPGDYVGLSVSDSGIGIASELRDRIFEPFFTTRSHQGGSGLGLAQVAEAVKRHGGYIVVDSTVGRGSQFTVLLPPDMGEDQNLPPPAGDITSLF